MHDYLTGGFTANTSLSHYCRDNGLLLPLSAMDSLVASYASSDEEEDLQPRREAFTVKSSEPSASSLFSAIPQPKELKSSEDGDLGSSSSRGKSSSFLSSLPPPKSSISRKKNPNPSSIPKRVVQIRLPVNPRPSNLDDEDDEEEEKARKKRKQMESASASHDSSVRSFLSAMPAPKSSQTLGALPSLGSGSGRRSNLETETPSIAFPQTDSGISDQQNQSYESFSHSNSETEQIVGVDNYYATGYDGGYETIPSGSSVGYDGSSYGGNTWNGGGFEAMTGLPEAVVAMDSGARRGRRGRNQMPEIVEVKQDELMKNRPRVDQVKSTGIAFGPAYQVCLLSKLFLLVFGCKNLGIVFRKA
jgi:proline-rich protein PRCC